MQKPMVGGWGDKRNKDWGKNGGKLHKKQGKRP